MTRSYHAAKYHDLIIRNIAGHRHCLRYLYANTTWYNASACNAVTRVRVCFGAALSTICSSILKSQVISYLFLRTQRFSRSRAKHELGATLLTTHCSKTNVASTFACASVKPLIGGIDICPHLPATPCLIDLTSMACTSALLLYLAAMF